MIAYLDRYAANFDLQPRFGETVHSVRRDRNAWFIEATQRSISASSVVVASGLNAEPVVPLISGVERFRGKVIHSAQYIDAKPFVGQSVLVIGMGNSGAEIALDLSEGGGRTTISVRNGVHIVPRELFGIPIQIAAITATKLLPSAAAKRCSRAFSIGLSATFRDMASTARPKAFCNGSPVREEFRSSMSVRFEKFLKERSRLHRASPRSPATARASAEETVTNSTRSSLPPGIAPITNFSHRPRCQQSRRPYLRSTKLEFNDLFCRI